MKKVLALLLALIMVLGLAACATKEAPAKTDDPAPADTTNTERPSRRLPTLLTRQSLSPSRSGSTAAT